MFLQTVVLIQVILLGEHLRRERFNAGGVIRIILELITQRHLTQIEDTGRTFLTLLYQVRYTQVLIINCTLIGFLVNSLYVINSGIAMAPQISGATRCVFSSVDMGAAGSLDNVYIEQYEGEDMRFNYINEGLSYVRRISLDASRSSSIYGAGSTIRPINISCKFFIRY